MLFKSFYCHLILVKTWCHNKGDICAGLCHFLCHFDGVPRSCEIETQVEALVNERNHFSFVGCEKKFDKFSQQVIVICRGIQRQKICEEGGLRSNADIFCMFIFLVEDGNKKIQILIFVQTTKRDHTCSTQPHN